MIRIIALLLLISGILYCKTAVGDEYKQAEAKILEAVSKKYGPVIDEKGRKILDTLGIPEAYVVNGALIGKAVIDKKVNWVIFEYDFRTDYYRVRWQQDF